MTEILSFTVLVDTEWPATDLQGKPLLSKERGADRLAAALTQLGHDVVIEEAPLATVAPGRWVLSFGGDPIKALTPGGTRREDVIARLVLMDENRVEAQELMEALEPALIVTSRAFQAWLHNSETPAQVFGRTAVARRLGIELPAEDLTERFALFTIPGLSLPEGIARYCAACELAI